MKILCPLVNQQISRLPDQPMMSLLGSAQNRPKLALFFKPLGDHFQEKVQTYLKSLGPRSAKVQVEHHLIG
jgi:hypothetical protein